MDGSSRPSESCTNSVWRLVLTSSGCVLCGGILPVWRIAQPEFVDAGVFAGDCSPRIPYTFAIASRGYVEEDCESQEAALSNVYIVGMFAMLASFWPTGFIFDYLGPWFCASVGSGMTLIGSVLMLEAVIYPFLPASCLYWGALLESIGPLLNAYGILGFLWEYPDNQGWIIGLYSFALASAIFIPLLFLLFLEFRTALYCVTFCAVGSFSLSVWATPSRAEYHASIANASSDKAAPSLSLVHRLKVFKRCVQRHPKENGLFFTNLFLAIAVQVYYNAVSDPFLVALLQSKKEADYINYMGVFLTALMGVVTAPLGGAISDAAGMILVLKITIVMNVALTPLLFVRNVHLQILNNALSQIVASVGQLFGMRWFSLYAPPENFGEFQGLSVTLIGLIGYPLCSVLQFASSAFGGLLQFEIPLLALQGTCALTSIWFCWHMCEVGVRNSPPSASLDSDEALTSSRTDEQQTVF